MGFGVKRHRAALLACVGMALLASGCSSGGDTTNDAGAPVVVVPAPTPTATPTPTPTPTAIMGVTESSSASFASPWAMVFMPDGDLLVTERTSTFVDPGRLWVVTQAGAKTQVAGLPTNIGVLDVALHPRF